MATDVKKQNIYASFGLLEQDEQSDIQLKKLISGDTSLFIAELKAGKILRAHYHNEGSEIYHVLSGKGKMETGLLSGADVAWKTECEILPGDVFVIEQKTVHRLSSSEEENLRLIFITPPSHLEQDRIFI